MNSKYQKIGFVSLSVLAIILVGIIIYRLIPQKVTINHNQLSGASVKIYQVNSSEDLHDLTDTKPIGREVKTLTGGGEIFLQRGTYTVSVSGQSVEPKQYPLTVSGETQKNITITYSQSYLEKLLKTIEPEITAVIRKHYPTVNTLYDIKHGKLYQSGEWYATRLRYIGGDEYSRDTLLVILKKTSTNWELITKVPEIVVTYPKYPSVPKAVIDDINSDEPIKIIPAGE